MFQLDKESGIELPEAEPEVTDEAAIASSISKELITIQLLNLPVMQPQSQVVEQAILSHCLIK